MSSRILPLLVLLAIGLAPTSAHSHRRIVKKPGTSLVAKVKHQLKRLSIRRSLQKQAKLKVTKPAAQEKLPSWYVPLISPMHAKSMKKYGVAIDEIVVRHPASGKHLTLSLKELDGLQAGKNNQWSLQRGGQSLVVDRLKISYIENLVVPLKGSQHLTSAPQDRVRHTWRPNLKELRAGRGPSTVIANTKSTAITKQPRQLTSQ